MAIYQALKIQPLCGVIITVLCFELTNDLAAQIAVADLTAAAEVAKPAVPSVRHDGFGHQNPLLLLGAARPRDGGESG